MQTIAENVRKHRERLAWTQAHLAEAAQVSERTVQRLERGEPIRAESLQSIAAALNVDLEELRFDESALAELLKKLQHEERDAAYTPVPLVKVERGADVSAFYGAHGMFFDDSALAADDARDVAAELNSWFRDAIDVWEEVDPRNRREFEKALDELLERARNVGVLLSAGTVRRAITFPNDPEPKNPMRWDFLVVIAAPEFKSFAMIPKSAPLRP